MLKLAALLLFVVATEAAFSCLNTPLTTATQSANLPPNEAGPVLVPKGTNCTYTFNIPNGYALSVSLSANFQSDQDTVSVIDSLGAIRRLVHTGSPINGAVIWLSATSARINVVGATGTSTFFAQYTFQPLNTYKQTQNVLTGNYFALSAIAAANSYYTISSKKDKVIATVGQRAGAGTDSVLDNIYVYDGDNLITAQYIGRLSDLGVSLRGKSSGFALTFVNFYGTRSNSYLLGNDASSVSNLSKYAVIMTSLGSNINADLTTSSPAAYTFICTDCSNFYIDQLYFDSLRTISNLGYAAYSGMSPTHGLEKLINYTAMAYTSSQMPQKIPASMFTLNLYMSGITVMTSSSNVATRWTTPYDGRKGFIFSPNLWNPSNTNIAYSEQFRNDSQLYNYQVNLNKLGFKSSSDSLRVQVGSGTGTPSLDNTYPKVSSSTGVVSARGNYMKLDFSGSAGSDVRVSFQMTIAKASSTIGVLASLAITLFYVL